MFVATKEANKSKLDKIKHKLRRYPFEESLRHCGFFQWFIFKVTAEQTETFLWRYSQVSVRDDLFTRKKHVLTLNGGFV